MPTTAEQELETAAALVKLLGAAAAAFALDDHERVEHLLGQVTQPACDRIAGILTTMADVSRLPALPPPVTADNVFLLRR